MLYVREGEEEGLPKAESTVIGTVYKNQQTHTYTLSYNSRREDHVLFVKIEGIKICNTAFLRRSHEEGRDRERM